MRHFFDALVTRHAVVLNPFHSVRGILPQVLDGTTLEISLSQARRLFAAIDLDSLMGLRDRAMLGTLITTGGRQRFVRNLQRLRDSASKTSRPPGQSIPAPFSAAECYVIGAFHAHVPEFSGGVSMSYPAKMGFRTLPVLLAMSQVPVAFQSTAPLEPKEKSVVVMVASNSSSTSAPTGHAINTLEASVPVELTDKLYFAQFANGGGLISQISLLTVGSEEAVNA